MLALGIDCATHSGCALVDRTNKRERIVDHRIVDLSGRAGRPSEVLSAYVRDLARLTSLEGLPVAIELPYLARGAQQNVVVLRTLARFCGRWEQALGVYGADVDLMMADHWQRRILGRFGGRKRAERKKAAQLWALGEFRLRLPEDEADAVAIAVCLLRDLDSEATLEAAKAL